MSFVRRAPLLIAGCFVLAAGLRWVGDVLVEAADRLDADVWEDEP